MTSWKPPHMTPMTMMETPPWRLHRLRASTMFSLVSKYDWALWPPRGPPEMTMAWFFPEKTCGIFPCEKVPWKNVETTIPSESFPARSHGFFSSGNSPSVHFEGIFPENSKQPASELGVSPWLYGNLQFFYPQRDGKSISLLIWIILFHLFGITIVNINHHHISIDLVVSLSIYNFTQVYGSHNHTWMGLQTNLKLGGPTLLNHLKSLKSPVEAVKFSPCQPSYYSYTPTHS